VQAADAAPSTLPKAIVDELWTSLRPLLERVRRVEQTWNDFAMLQA
jgi:hypothetical protein